MLILCNTVFMLKVININDRGTLTLPKEARDRLGIHQSGQVVLEDTPDGLLLRPGVTFPMEIYSEARLNDFKRAEAELEPFADAMRAALAKARPKARKK
jgi:AbrB family looped-hinge helix DNA binding protein